MKALVMHGPGIVTIEDVPEPVRKPGEALLRVRRVGLCGTDLSSYRGRNPLVSYPRIPGHEIAATIVELPEEAHGLRTGMDVTLSPYTCCNDCASCRNQRPNACQCNQTMGVQRDGALAEYIRVPVEKLYTAQLGLTELCLVEPLTVGFHAVARAQVTPQDVAVIFGCGGVGLGAVAASAFRNAITVAIDVDDDKLEIARRAGATHTIHSRRQEIAPILAELTGGNGPDVIIEAVGMAQTFRSAVELVSFTGRVVYIGYAKEEVSYETKSFVQKELDIRGSRNALPEDFRQVIRMLERGHFPVDATVSRIAPLEEAPALLKAWDANPAAFTKIMLTLDT
ncbi:zinc-binding alcohol dehydrogenase family protein [Silvibacterium dinghuense]|uniref:Zinc-binding alcohol dehydrogenase family protein n=1 Tax=Silvibacterium dinghuense TaxID=1560006 RepID=A0A4Q1SBX6_9BACT|nr:zinc-binding alcohol dehydrogenase family protein [Silvibacterium dinghuense]RXS94529.1 zinc-binding alcohol dehydrogenase family protein [Silvibacterium dinghuense]GGH15553.1 sorbitol dehydrogenase [Silvibacterium dinghuense]